MIIHLSKAHQRYHDLPQTCLFCDFVDISNH